MNGFTIEGFAAESKAAMAVADVPHQALSELLERTIRENDPADIIATLEAAIPPGADIGEMIVHTSPELTMLYARVPPRFQSAIHNHTVFASIGQLDGEEISIVYDRAADGEGLVELDTLRSRPGEVTNLYADAIHRIENPLDRVSSALHCYGGNFPELADKRSLWAWSDHAELPFSFPDLLKQSVAVMKGTGNDAGLIALAEAIPTAKAMIDAE